MNSQLKLFSFLQRCIGHYLKENPLAAEASDSASLPVDNSVTHHQMLEDQNAVNRKCDGIFLKLLELKVHALTLIESLIVVQIVIFIPRRALEF